MNTDNGAQGVARPARLKVFQPIEIDGGAGPTRAHLLDVSSAGALLHSVCPFDQGQFLWIVLGETRYKARVAWRTDKRFGIEFVGKLSAAQIDDVLAAQTNLTADAAPAVHAA